MSQFVSSTSNVTSSKGKVHTNRPINPFNVVRATKVESRWDGREYSKYPAIEMEIEDCGVQYLFYAKGDEATRDADYTTLDSQINI
jgi:hypothetical protein